MNEILNFLSYLKQGIFKTTEPFGQNDFIIIILFIIILILIINFFSRRRLAKKIEQVPGLELNDKIFSDIKYINEQLKHLNIFKTHSENNFNNISKAFKNVKIIKSKKYNPYADMGVGGNQSFSLALVNTLGDGVIITSLYSRDRTRLLLKEVNNFIAEQELTKEENEVLEEIKKTI